VVSGRLQFKLDEEILDVEGGSAVRVAPEVVRSVWNEGPHDAQLLILSLRVENVDEDAEIVENFWPE
jgi:mannose-6-phosphate isomerase-like protein (cupin superfamily)